MLVHVHAMQIYIDGWCVELSNGKDPDAHTFRIGPFRWDDPAIITREFVSASRVVPLV
jgi:hypothetical protein